MNGQEELLPGGGRWVGDGRASVSSASGDRGWAAGSLLPDAHGIWWHRCWFPTEFSSIYRPEETTQWCLGSGPFPRHRWHGSTGLHLSGGCNSWGPFYVQGLWLKSSPHLLKQRKSPCHFLCHKSLLSSTGYTTAALPPASGHPGLETVHRCTLRSTVRHSQHSRWWRHARDTAPDTGRQAFQPLAVHRWKLAHRDLAYLNVQSLCCTPESNTVLYPNNQWKNKENKSPGGEDLDPPQRCVRPPYVMPVASELPERVAPSEGKASSSQHEVSFGEHAFLTASHTPRTCQDTVWDYTLNEFLCESGWKPFKNFNLGPQ